MAASYFDKKNDAAKQNKTEVDLLAQFDPLSEFNILAYVKWDDETLAILSNQWGLRGSEGVSIAEFIHIMLKVFPKPDRRNPNQKKQWVQKLINFYRQIDYNHNNKVIWQDFLSFITACCVFDREKTRVDTVVQYHFEKEIIDKSGNFTVLRFLYDPINDHILSFNANGVVQIYSPTSLNLIRKIRLHGRPINAVYDGTLIPERNLMTLLYPTGIQILSTLQGCTLAQDIPTTDTTHFCIMYDTTTNSMLTGTENGRLHCWRAENWGEKPSRMNWHCVSTTKVTQTGKPVTCVTPIPDSSSFVTGDEEGYLIVWDRKNIRLIHRIAAHRAPIHTIVHSESLHALITGAYESTICAWNPFIPFMISKITCPTGVVTAMTCLPDSPHLVIADRSGSLHIINSRTMTIVQTFNISPFGQFTNRVNLTETAHKQLTHALHITGSFPVTALSHCGPRKRFVLGGRMIQFYEYEENIQPMLSDRLPIRSALVNRQFHIIATCSGQNIRHWEIKTGLMRCVFRKNAPSLITSMCLDDAETLLFIGCHEGQLIATHFPTGQLLHVIGIQPAEITSVAYIRKLKMVATSSWGGVVSLWDNEPNGKRIDLLTEKKEDILSMAVNQEFLLIAAGVGNGDINVWNLNELKLMCVLRPQKNDTEILTLSFVEGSSLLVSSDADGYITFWNVATEDPIPVAQLPNFYIDSTTSSILALTFCDNFLITGDHCGEVRLWDCSQLTQQYPENKKFMQVVEDVSEFQTVLNQKGQIANHYTTTVKTIDSKNCALPVGSFQLILKWKCHHNAITSVSTFKARGVPIVLTSSNDCCCAVWEMKTGKCLGYLQSNPQFGLSERKWALDYEPRRDQIITSEEIYALVEQAEDVKTPLNSPR